ncbi:MAG: GNAT family protein [Bacteroidales bacterium]|nr:GNAT family protein [Bacteroidales bacterium]
MKIIREHYILRKWEIADAHSLSENIGNIHIWNNVRDALPYPYTVKDAIAFIEMNQGRKNCNFAIEINGIAVGGVGFIPQKDVERLNAEIGYWLGEKFWNKGIMSQALRDLVDYIFTETEIIRLFASVFDFNKSSMRVLEKVGFEKKAVFRKAAIKKNQIIDMHYYELLKPGLE